MAVTLAVDLQLKGQAELFQKLNEAISSLNKFTKAVQQSQVNLDGSAKSFQKVNTQLQINTEKVAQNAAGMGLATNSSDAFRDSIQGLNERVEKVSDGIEGLHTIQSNLITSVSALVVGYTLLDKVSLQTIAQFTGVERQFLKVTNAFAQGPVAVNAFDKGINTLFKTIFEGNKNIFALTANLATLSVGFLALGNVLTKSENDFVRITGKISILASIITGTFAAAVTAGVIIVGKFLRSVGTDLVEANEKAAESFAKFEKTGVIFERTINNFNKAFGNSVGTVDSWAAVVERVSQEARILPSELQKVVSEVVAVGSSLGLAEPQMVKLVEATADFAKGAGKDAFDTAVDLLTAINGNTQGVVKYGVKLGEASLQHFAFDKGLNKNIETLSDSEKIQLRYQKLIETYNLNAKGQAAVVGETLVGAQESLNFTLGNLSTSYGRGAAVVENYNLASFLANKVLRLVNTNVIAATGFFGALGGRVLQVAGFFLEWSFKILAVVKVLGLLQNVLRSNIFQSLISTELPFLNSSFVQLVKSSGASFVSFSSLQNIVKTVGSVFASSGKNIIAGLFGINAASLTLTGTLSALSRVMLTGVVTAMRAVLTTSLALLANPLVLGIVAATVAFVGLAKVLGTVEEKTGFFAQVFAVIKGVLAGVNPLFAFLSTTVTSIFDQITLLASQGFGLLIAKLSEGLQKLTEFALSFSLVRKAVGAEGIKGLQGAADSVGSLSKSLAAANFDFRQLPANINRSTAAAGGLHENFEELLKSLNEVEKSLEKAGKSQIQLAQESFKKTIDILARAEQAKFRNEDEIRKLRKLAEIKFQGELVKAQEEAAKKAEEANKKRVAGFQGFIDQLRGKEPGTGPQADRTKPSSGEQLGLQGGFVLENVLKGAKGAESLVTGLLGGAIAGALGPIGQILGPVINQLLETLSQGPAKVRETVQEFSKAIPIVIENIIASLPVLLEELVIGLSGAIVTLVDRFPEIADNFLIAITGLVQNEKFINALIAAFIKGSLVLQAQMPFIAVTFALSLQKQAPTIALAIAKATAQAVTDQLKVVLKDITGIGGGGAGGPIKGAVEGIGKVFGFADGGEVPGNAPFVDRIPSLLTPKEIVVSRKERSAFSDGLAAMDSKISALGQLLGGEGGRNLNLQLQVGEQSLSRVELNLNRQGFRNK